MKPALFVAHGDFMRRQFAAILSLILVGWAVTSSCSAQELHHRRVAITFDDAPRPQDAFFSRAERAQRILGHLAAAEVRAIFFCTTGRLDDEGRVLLRAYGAAGHQISNHSRDHMRADTLGAQRFFVDLDAADAALADMPGFVRMFRFPFLNEGATRDLRDEMRAGLAERGYRAGYVTIDNYDWYVNSLANRAMRANRRLDLDGLRTLYVSTLIEAAEHYDGLAQAYLGRSPAHVLLLHENDMAALFLGDLIAAFRERGWEVIDADAAYADEIAAVEPDTLVLNQGRVAALASLAGAPPRALVSVGEEEEVLDRRFEREVVIP